MVVISAPSACIASTAQLFTDTPFMCTVHAPQLDVSQPIGSTGLAEPVSQVMDKQQAGFHLI